MKENGFKLTNEISRRYAAKTKRKQKNKKNNYRPEIHR